MFLTNIYLIKDNIIIIYNSYIEFYYGLLISYTLIIYYILYDSLYKSLVYIMNNSLIYSIKIYIFLLQFY